VRIKILSIFTLYILGTIELWAVTLKDVVSQTLENSPIIIERLHNYRATREEISIADAGYYPTLDLQSSVGRKSTGKISGSTDVAEETFNVFQNSLVLRQNIFNGFSTHEQVTYQKMRTLSAAYSYLEKANDITLQTIKAYVNLLKERELMYNSKSYLDEIERLYVKVKKAYKAGLTKLSEVSKIQSSLSLAKSNYLVQENKLSIVLYNYRRVTGSVANLSKMEKVSFTHTLPQNQEEASMSALEYNPSILVGNYNIKGAEALYRESKSKFYPKIDIEISENYNENYNEFSGVDDRFQAMLIVSYNLFNGGADEASRRNKLSKVSQEVSVTQDLRRQVMEGLDLSWSAYELAHDQMTFLENYYKESKKTLELYNKEYDMGERSLLDLLATQNDLKRSKDEIINSTYNLLIAKYRILDAMGLTMASVMGSVSKYYHKVGLYTNGINTGEDTLPLSLDKDGDGIPNDKDLCNSTKKGAKVLPFGCTQSINALDTIRLK
jgi:adhesin transport system outer membrane protein